MKLLRPLDAGKGIEGVTTNQFPDRLWRLKRRHSVDSSMSSTRYTVCQSSLSWRDLNRHVDKLADAYELVEGTLGQVLSNTEG